MNKLIPGGIQPASRPVSGQEVAGRIESDANQNAYSLAARFKILRFLGSRIIRSGFDTRGRFNRRSSGRRPHDPTKVVIVYSGVAKMSRNKK